MSEETNKTAQANDDCSKYQNEEERLLSGLSQPMKELYLHVSREYNIPLVVLTGMTVGSRKEGVTANVKTTATEPIKQHLHQVGNSASCHQYRVPVQMPGESVKDFFERCCKETESQRHSDFIHSHPQAFYPSKCRQPGPTVTYVDAETTKIRKHTHDTLWAVLAGFAAASGLMVIMAAIVLAILSFARGL